MDDLQQSGDKSVNGGNSVRDTFERPLQDLRISLLDRCNLRCPYCMPEAEFHADYQFLTRMQRLSHDEIVRIAAVAVGLG